MAPAARDVSFSCCGTRTPGKPTVFPTFLRGETSVSPTPFLQVPQDSFALLIRAAGLGLEPRYTAPEAVVLPLDDPAMGRSLADILYFSAPQRLSVFIALFFALLYSTV